MLISQLFFHWGGRFCLLRSFPKECRRATDGLLRNLFRNLLSQRLTEYRTGRAYTQEDELLLGCC